MLGGTFDPVHAAHLAMARAARKALRLDRVLLVPARLSPFKSRPPAPARHRLAMLKLAVGKTPWLEVATLELRRPAPSYTVDTLKALRRRFPGGTEFILLMGADSAITMHKWFKHKELTKLSTAAVFRRPGTRIPRGMLRVPMPQQGVSSTMLRASKAPGKGWIPSVLAYARRFQLYSR